MQLCKTNLRIIMTFARETGRIIYCVRKLFYFDVCFVLLDKTHFILCNEKRQPEGMCSFWKRWHSIFKFPIVKCGNSSFFLNVVYALKAWAFHIKIRSLRISQLYLPRPTQLPKRFAIWKRWHSIIKFPSTAVKERVSRC